MQTIEKQDVWQDRFNRWSLSESLRGYPWVENVHSVFTPLKRALPLLNLALISSAGAHIVGTDAFDTSAKDGDLEFREFPIEVGAEDFEYTAKGYDPSAVREDRNCQIPIDRLVEYRSS